MDFDFKDIFEEQKQLDAIIQKNHNVNYDDVQNELIVALAVELGELANEVRCFKFWSFKERSSDDVILEEYADGIHFITSISIAHNASSTISAIENRMRKGKHELTEMFKELFFNLNKLNTPKQINEWYAQYLELGLALGFSIDQIKNAYYAKHDKNIKRQENNY